MADNQMPPKPDSLPEGVKYEAPKVPPKQNPVFRMMGMPNFRLRLPSRNWMIFLSIVGSWTGAVVYDKREKKKAQKKWCDLVAHVAHQTLPVNQMPRKLTVFISAPPGDGIRPSRQYFKEYVKPVLVAAAMDYDVIEGRKEGDVRYGTAEQIRRLRRKKGEDGADMIEAEMDAETAIDMVREKMFIVPEAGVRGDLVLGRHTWKEYVRGLHEGWLGPVREPLQPPESIPLPEVEPSPVHPPTEARTDNPAATTETATIATPSEAEQKPAEEEKKEETKKPYPPPAYLGIDKYSSATPSRHIPGIFEPSQPIHQQHLLGFLKTPQRIYHFLTRRHLADQIGRETAAIVLAASRPYQQDSSFSTFTDSPSDLDPVATRAPESDASPSSSNPSPTSQYSWEQQSLLVEEEPKWHKSTRKPRKEDDKSEPLFMAGMVIDERIGSRMRKFEIEPDEEARANRLASGVEKPNVPEPIDLRKEKVVIGNLDDD
ncbi:mitochondrial import inner membrane translocase subunit tim54 [Cladophialophora chaetospira]|uniref:Mitochondrial import inner membrane translocase subunit TIM54 n=1 Tax=Cladophialophora chaetospira TaxID=386627 RepID=A0AA38X4C2_9EURO|nr:mitochondrial import inner membrane translocase subunit tim54 [Cladophialophora chaetospira]